MRQHMRWFKAIYCRWLYLKDWKLQCLVNTFLISDKKGVSYLRFELISVRGIFSINRALHFSKIFYFDSLKVNNAPKYRLSKDYMNCGLMILVYKLKSLNTCCILHSSLSSGNPTIKKEACQLFFMGDFAVIYHRILSLSFPPLISQVSF